MRQFLFVFILLGFFSLISCTSEECCDNPIDKETTVEEDKNNLTNALDNTLACIDNLENGAFIDALMDFIGLADEEMLNEDWIVDVFNPLEDAFDFYAIEDDLMFDFEYHKGIYEYSIATGKWSKTANSDRVEWRFPATPSSTTNNAVLACTSYSHERLNIDGDEVWLPNTANITLTVDGSEIGYIKLNNAIYEKEGSINLPTDVDLTIYTAPYTHTLKASQSGNEYTGSFSMNNNGGCAKGVEATVALNIGDIEDLNDEKDISSIKVSLFSEDMRAEVTINGDLLVISADNDPTPSQIRANTQVNMFMNGELIGELDYREIDGSEEVFMIYKDGTEENADIYYEDFINDLENLLAEYL